MGNQRRRGGNGHSGGPEGLVFLLPPIYQPSASIAHLCVHSGLPGAALRGFESPRPSASLAVCPGEQRGLQLGSMGLRVCNEFPCLDPQLHEELPQEQPHSRIPFLPSLIQLFSSPSSFSLSANAQQMGGNAILNATAS